MRKNNVFRLLSALLALVFVLGLLPAAAVNVTRGEDARKLSEAGDPTEINEASVSWYYRLYENTSYGRSWVYYLYEICNYPTLQAALDAACAQPDYRDKIQDLPEDVQFKYANAVVTLLKDITIEEDETITADTKNSIYIDLNGFTLNMEGTFNGEARYEIYDEKEGVYKTNVYPADVYLYSEIPGTFITTGTINVAITSWFGDNLVFAGGVINAQTEAYGGNVTITGGYFNHYLHFENYSDTDLVVSVSGNPEFRYLFDITVNNVDPTNDIKATIDGNAKFIYILIDAYGTKKLDTPALTINGGYFADDPMMITDVNWLFEVTYEPEEYTNQIDWEADGSEYGFRVKSSSVLVGDVNDDGHINNKDVVALFKYVSSGSTDGVIAVLDVNGDGYINNKDVVALFKHVSSN